MPRSRTATTATDRTPSRSWRPGPFGAIWVATVLLFAVSPLLASSSLSNSSLQAMLPFAAVLAVAAVGQTLVVQQGGLDLSVPGTFSLGVVLVVVVPGGDPGRLWLGLVVVIAVGLAAGLLNGIAVTRLGITPLVATLGMNGLLVGTVLQVTGGRINYEATSNWGDFVGARLLGVPVVALLAVVFVALVAVVMRRSLGGRWFELIGTSPRAARAAGLPVRRFQLLSYVAAGSCYALAGALLAGVLGRPQLFAGDDYLLPTIAAVVLGGTALGGGRASVVATAVGVLFFSQLDQLLEVLGASQAIQYCIQGAIVALGMGLRQVPWSRLRSTQSRPSAASPGGAAEEPATAPAVSPVA